MLWWSRIRRCCATVARWMVWCYDCPASPAGPRKWEWWCEDCARECQNTHAAVTGHDLQTVNVELPGVDGVQTMIRAVQNNLRRGGW